MTKFLVLTLRTPAAPGYVGANVFYSPRAPFSLTGNILAKLEKCLDIAENGICLLLGSNGFLMGRNMRKVRRAR